MISYAEQYQRICMLDSIPRCAPGAQNRNRNEAVIKFSHVTNTDKHPKGIAATLLAERVNKEMNGKACMDCLLYTSDAADE